MPEPSVDFHYPLPRSWHRELKAAAEAQHLSMADLNRMLVRNFLRGRLTTEEQRTLGVDK